MIGRSVATRNRRAASHYSGTVEKRGGTQVRCANEPRDKGKPLSEAVPFPSFLPLIITSRARTHDAARRELEAHF